MTERFVSALDSLELGDVVISMESTFICENHLVHSQREDGRLGRYRRNIHVLNSTHVSKFKKAYLDLPKHDGVDAFVIADHLRFGRIMSKDYMDDYRYEALKTLTLTAGKLVRLVFRLLKDNRLYNAR